MVLLRGTLLRQLSRWACLAGILALPAMVVGCKGNDRLAPIEQFDQPPAIKLNHHTVSRGDTLYSIAWRYGMDYHQLARLNTINPPYTIYVGQKLAISDDSSGARSGRYVTTVSPGTEIVAVPDSGTGGVTEVGGVTEITPVDAVREPPALPQPETVKPVAEQSVERMPAAAATGGGGWRWPASGRVLQTFLATDPLRKGIDIEGKLGEPVLAASAGSVVYAGSGLAGYGQLVIVKHDEQFLSAYGHNSVLLVKEGDTVRGGQKIAEIGSSGTDSNKLHFEIRRNGKPVDPLQYLPKR